MKKTWPHTGTLIRKSRELKGISQLELTRAVIGKSDNGQFFWNIEAGKAGLPVKHIFRTSQILELTLPEIKEALVKDYKDSLERHIQEELSKL